MDILDRYLGAVAALLPAAEREDITAELRDVLLTRFEEREAALGRSLTELEREAVIQAYGHPLEVAGRYRPDQHLIGPALYPFYAFAVKTALTVLFAVGVVVALAYVIADPGHATRTLINTAEEFLTAGLMLFGLVTILAALAERGWIKLGFLKNWRPSNLPAVKPQAKPGRDRRNSLFELVVSCLFLLWLVGGFSVPMRGGEHLSLSPAALALKPALIAAVLVQIGSQIYDVVRPAWTRSRAALRIGANLALLSLGAAAWNARPLVSVPDAGAQAERVRQTLELSIDITLGIFAAIVIAQILMDLWRLVRLSAAPRLTRA